MLKIEQFKEFLPQKLTCKKVSKTEDLTQYAYDIFYGYDEKGQVYTISKDKKGLLHMLGRDFEQEERIKYEAIMKIGEDMTMSWDPLNATQKPKKDNEPNILVKEIILEPLQDRTRKTYKSITVKLGKQMYSIVNTDGIAQLLENESEIVTTSYEQKQILETLKKPFEISLVDRIKIRNIPINNGMDRVDHIASTFPKSSFVNVTPERMKEWEEAEI